MTDTPEKPVHRFPPSTGRLTWSGERFLVGRTGEIEFEHYHRYLFAAQFCSKLDVLDIACGEGYGAFLLGGTAREVIGVDIAPDAVRAAKAAYARPGLRFIEGSCLAIPLPDASVDVVVSFETIEHIADHETFLGEVKRVLRARGLAIFSTPDRELYSAPGSEMNPFHLRELSRDEFVALLKTHFLHSCVGVQKATSGSVILPAEGAPELLETFTRLDDSHFAVAPRPLGAPFLLALASDAVLPPVRWGLLDDANFLREIQQRVADTDARLNAEVGRLGSEVQRVNAAFSERETEVLRVNAELDKAKAAYKAHAEDILRLHAELDKAKAACKAHAEEVLRLNAELDKVKAACKAHAEEVEHVRAQLHEVLASSSWRLTGPLRGVKRVLFGGSEGRQLVLEQIRRPRRVPAVLSSSTAETVPFVPPCAPMLRDANAASGGSCTLLLVTHDCSRTGAPMVCFNLLTELVRRGGRCVEIIAMSGGELASAMAALAPVHILSEARPGVAPAVTFTEVLSHFGHRPAAAICNTIVTAPLLPALREAGIPVITLVHELPTTISIFGEETMRTVQEFSTDVVFGSSHVRDRVAAAFGAGAPRTHIIPTGYPPPLFSHAERPQLRRRLLAKIGAQEEALVVVGCGTIDHRKGPDLFVQIAARVAAEPEGRSAQFLWLGAGSREYLRWLRHDAVHLGVEERMHFLGSVEDVNPLIAGADVFLLTSREDPYPLVSIAALACGVPVIAFAGAGGAPEAIGSEAGIVVPYLDVTAMTKALLLLATDPDRRARLGAGGQRRFAEEHAIDTFTDRILALLPTNGVPRRGSDDARFGGCSFI